ALLNDIFGQQQALLKASGIVPSGSPDQVGASQYLQSIVEIAAGRAVSYDEVGSADAYVLATRGNMQAPASYFDGMKIRFTPGSVNTGASTVDVGGLGVKNIFSGRTGVALIGNELVVTRVHEAVYDGAQFLLDVPTGIMVKRSFVADGTVATGTTTTPLDNSIAHITEGNEYMALAHTADSVDNILEIDVRISRMGNSGTDPIITMHLHQDAIGDALASVSVDAAGGYKAPGGVTLRHVMVAGSTASQTFRLRLGANVAGTTTFNGSATSQTGGGRGTSSISIKEYKA
ncbi:MAG: hypothetical protein GY815_05890, partial [Gammaproteobacteria bacterium]|nr:hypothetical protein [Gammaproteobacteria bacterium]